jgi:hypothetical protein
MRQTATAEVRLDEGKATSSSTARRATRRFGFEQRQLRSNFVAARLDETENRAQQPGNLGNVGLSEQSKREECYMRWIFAAAAVAITGLGLLTLDGSPTEAAIFSVGPPNGSTGNFVCMDVSGNSLTPGTPVIAYDCHAGPNQQFQFAGPRGRTIYAESGQTCLDVQGAAFADGTLVQSFTCNGTVAQQFLYDGRIVNFRGELFKCLDAGDRANLTQLVINTCDGSPSQQWQIKAAVFSVGPPDGSAGNFVCMDVSGNSLTPGTPVIAYDCHAGPNQQFQFAGPAGRTIYAESGQRCLTVHGGGTADGTPVESSLCNEESQAFVYNFGEIQRFVSVGPSGCLDAGDMENLTQLVINTCNFGSPSQQWQIK